MFEKPNEVDEKIGNVGSVKVDIRPNLTVKAAADIGFDKDLIAAVPGALKMRAAVVLEVDSDPLALAAYGLGKVDNPIVKFLADQLAKFRAGQPVDAAVMAAAQAQPAIAEQAPEQKA